MLVFAGLGNPGAKYQNNRHNVGFMAADAIARRHSFSPWSKKFQGLISEGTLGGDKVLLIKPQTFMNLSGQSVGEALRFYKLDAAALTVFYDEIDLAAGKVRVKVGGGSGGHNGIRSLDQHVGNAYRRVRIGVGHPGVKEMVHGHVLGDFAKADREWLDVLLDAIADDAGLLAKGDDNSFMNRITLALRDKLVPTSDDDRPPPKAPKQKSHIRQARPQQPPAKVPESGPMAAMLKKLFGKD
ncbi:MULTISPECIES: aminoacyl-tRNA hydrolase [unclassified Mesorhizobium]|uniref:aminoacyl-tRNA hydrolase n=1 Tax=unclassified Mesorhizobium TaxID=325217 RepID=UPI000FCC1514|nr:MULTISPECIES: aminoacyl-tRNA hydrolase [unclassified Mesorhizobium]TGP19112.1 aminoacyl-tRNA hydrolase [Mesorhizobium sp. M1D.F.Ca.ET.231.01.1.1]TGP25738.1 aminoacyl-tRNA hydrolase [Mesorhizobium sp. M1D.F.Ca.ET.234.01.1.1]TGS40549.1 aminoacyl-tRNA hydrolase [Mesorhizobium sp. M1D.F.Ca.ET.184.01.1.1]TGS58994.1 aminoacyl-tRNA hydrolase [Mesorhizobium sp. M1D.F.Ca.ET.183.01.1.1]